MAGQVTVTIKDKQWGVLVANTLAELTSGLAGLESIPDETGMLFDLGYDQKFVQVDMSGMLFPLDIVFVSSTQGVVGVLHNVEPREEASLQNEALPGARCFLEVNAGEAEGIEVGDSVAIEGYAQPAQVSIGSLLNVMAIFMVMVMMSRMVSKMLAPAKKVLYGPSGERLQPQTSPQEGLASRVLAGLGSKEAGYRAYVRYPKDKSAFATIGAIVGGHYSRNPAGFTVWVAAWERNPEFPPDSILAIKELRRPRSFEATEEGVKQALEYVEKEFPTFTETCRVSRSIPVYVARELGILKLEQLPRTTEGSGYCDRCGGKSQAVKHCPAGGWLCDECYRKQKEAARRMDVTQPRLIPTKRVEPGPPGDLKYLADSPEFLAQTIETIGYRERLDDAFQEAIARAKRD